MIKKIVLFVLIALFPLYAFSRTVYDYQGANVKELFAKADTKYIISHNHHFTDTLYVPRNSKLVFDGGSLNGPIVFQNTKLSGLVNLKGSSIRGTIQNRVFNAAWICNMDGKTDDASIINDIIRVCGNVLFPKGRYCLISEYDPRGDVPDIVISSIKTHIGINRGDVTLRGEDGTVFESVGPLGTLYVFSQPNKINKSISNINIENITFKVYNDGENFYEFMHTIKLIGVKNMNIINCFFDDFWGDAICLSHYGDNPQTGERTRNQNVNICNNLIIGGEHYNNRNGISVINGKNVLIKNNTIKNTSRKDMPGGIDIEPNNEAYTIEDIRVEDNVLEGIKGVGGAIGLVVYDNGPAHNIHITGNRISNSSNGILIYVKTEDTTDNIVVKNNFVAWDTNPYSFAGGGKSKKWVITGNIFEHWGFQEIPGNIKVDKLVIENNKKKD